MALSRVISIFFGGLFIHVASALALTDTEIITQLRTPENSTGNIADAVETVTGHRGWMSADMKPLFDVKIVGKAATVLMTRIEPGDNVYSEVPPYHLQILDSAEPGSILVYVMEEGLDIAAIGNLMATTAQIRGLEGIVIDGATRDITAIKEIQFPVFTRRISPATSVGRMVPVAKQIAVMCGGVLVNPGDFIVGDPDGVIVIPHEVAEDVLKLLTEYNQKESKMMPIIKREKSILKAIEIYNRY
ncbi:MAG: RraA family protein [Proteobacteria bacterium]|nr:RraA family protein [Pseudomonadota bacterium]